MTGPQHGVVDLIIDGSSGDAELEANLALMMQSYLEMFKKKQASYGPGNIAKGGEKGVILRMSDKLERLWRLVWQAKPNTLVDDESIEDTYFDMVGYALIAILVRRGLWPKQVWDAKEEG